jgi:putative toxin-antitoxin system antitoxin component (TIGR02293 family)
MGASKPKEKSGRNGGWGKKDAGSGKATTLVSGRSSAGKKYSLNATDSLPPKGELISKLTRKPKEEVSALDIIAATRHGFPRKALEDLARALDVERVAELDRILNISKRSLQRYESKAKDEPLSVELSDHILQVVKVYERTMEVFGDRERALRWLKSPIMALGSEVPLSLLDTSAGVDLVLDELGRLEHGIFA